MYRIGIIGSENSHAAGFAELINRSGRYPDLRVVSIFGEEVEASRKIQAEFGVDEIAPDALSMLGKIDALMVTSRDGALHARYALPYLERGIPAFIDKPFTRDALEAEALIRLAEAHGAKIMGGSGTKYVPDVLALRKFAQAQTPIGGHVWAPVSMNNPYGNFYFYAAHLVEICLMIFGDHPRAVLASESRAGLSATLNYADFDVQLSFLEGVYHYGATVLTASGAQTRNISIDGFTEGLLERFAHMLRTGEVPQTSPSLLAPVKLLCAIESARLNSEIKPAVPI